MTAPSQNPGRSKQDYGTPREFLDAGTKFWPPRRDNLDRVGREGAWRVARGMYPYKGREEYGEDIIADCVTEAAREAALRLLSGGCE